MNGPKSSNYWKIYVCGGGASQSVPPSNQELRMEKNNVGSEVTLHEYLCLFIRCRTMAVDVVLAP